MLTGLGTAPGLQAPASRIDAACCYSIGVASWVRIKSAGTGGRSTAQHAAAAAAAAAPTARPRPACTVHQPRGAAVGRAHTCDVQHSALVLIIDVEDESVSQRN